MLKKVGKVMLLVTGIIFLVLGVWSLITAGIGLGAAITGLASNHDDGLVVLIVGIVVLVISVILMLFYVFAGIRGIKSFTKGDNKNVTKAFVWAILILIFNITPVFFSGIASLDLAANYSALVVDAVYVVGAFFVKLSK